MRGLRASLVSLVVLLSACGGTGERACDLVDDLPARAGSATVEDLREVAEAARGSDEQRIRTIGESLTNTLARARVLEELAAGLAAEVLQMNIDDLRQACRSISDEG
jgi:hypothetical protein